MKKSLKSLTIGLSSATALLGSMVLVSSAQAATVWTGSLADFIASPVTVGDKIFTYTSSTGLPANSGDRIDIEQFGNDYLFNYDFSPISQIPAFELAYNVTILSGASFRAVDIDSDVNAFQPEEVLEATYTPNVGSPVVLRSINGSQNPAELPIGGTSIDVFNSYTYGGPGGAIDSFENSFKQVPEPSSILGLAALSSLGFFSAKRKRKSNPL